MAAAVLASYAPNLYALGRLWWLEPSYSHGFLVGPIALAILWQRRGQLDRDRLRPHWAGWALLLLVLAARAWLYERNEQWAENATLLPVLLALALAFGGWPLLRWALPAIGFLVFMLPLPPRLNMTLAGPLQRLATLGSTSLLQGLGLPVLAQGNVILIGADRLEVAQACNGLSMLMSFVTLVTATVIFLCGTRPLWERALILASAIPIALIVNILRIVGTAWAYYAFGSQAPLIWPLSLAFATVEQLAHDLAGWAMMPIALVFVLAEMLLLHWLIVEEAPEPERRLVLPTTGYPAPQT